MALVFTDQLGRAVHLSAPPVRIISLVPSQTELLFDLGLDNRVVGITKFCIHPDAWHQTKGKVGGTKDLWFDAILSMSPDLIIGNKEENDRDAIDRLQALFPVWMSDISRFEDALSMIQLVGAMTDTVSAALTILSDIRGAFNALVSKPPLRTLYLVWQNPWMGAGPDTFIHAMLEKIGLVNCLEETRYPVLTREAIQRLSPELVLLPSEPFPFREKHIESLQRMLPGATIRLVDGEMFSWYGSRLILAPAYFNTLTV